MKKVYFMWQIKSPECFLKKLENLLAGKLKLFCQDIQPKRQQITKNEKMMLQTDLEFQQIEIKKMNQKYNVEMFGSRVRGEKAYTAEQKIRDKKLFFKPNGCIKQLLLNVLIQKK